MLQDKEVVSMFTGSVWEYLQEVMKNHGVTHLTLIDPDPQRQKPEQAAQIAHYATKAGSDGIMVGGSIARLLLDDTVKSIKKKTDKPIILFPGNVNGLSEYADAVFFMSLLNSHNPYFIMGAQVLSAFTIKSLKLEPISMAYLIIDPGAAAGYIGEARLLPRNKPSITAAYALAAQYLGFNLVYLEAGSGADQSVPLAIVKAVKQEINIPVLVGGGIETANQAVDLVNAGADMIVQGTFVERSVMEDGGKALNSIITEIKKAGKKRKNK